MPPGSTSHPQGPTLISVITVIRSSLWPQTQLQPHCLSFQANTTPLSPASKNHLPKSPAPKSILWLCLLEKADWSKHFSSTSTLHGHPYCCCCCCFHCLHPDPAAKSVLHHCFHFLPSLLQKQATEDQQFYCPWKACAQATRPPQINHLLEVFFLIEIL